MKKYIILLIMVSLFWVFNSFGQDAYYEESKKDSKANDTLFLESHINIDTLISLLLDNKNNGFKIFPEVGYNSTESIRQYTVAHGSFNIKIDRLDSESAKKYFVLNNDTLMVFNVPHERFNLALDPLLIDYRDSDFYLVSNGMLIVIISYPMQFTGLMSNFSLYEIIDIDNKCIYRTLGFGSIPYIVSKFSKSGISMIQVDGDYEPSTQDWGISGKKLNLGSTMKYIKFEYNSKTYKVFVSK